MKNLAYLFLFVFLVSCAPQPLLTNKERSDLEYLVGKPAKNVIYSYGPPAEKVQDESVGEIWIYYFDVDQPPVKTSQMAVGGRSHTKKFMFFIENDRVSHWTVTKNDSSTDRAYIY